jgi:hypothetical protein
MTCGLSDLGECSAMILASLFCMVFPVEQSVVNKMECSQNIVVGFMTIVFFHKNPDGTTNISSSVNNLSIGSLENEY